MKENKIKTITKLFEGYEIRSIWNIDEEDYYFSVIDVIGALTDNSYQKARNYWKWLKNKLNNEGSQLVSNTNRLKLKAKDSKMRETDILNTEGIFRLIESIPSPKAEPFKLWLAKLGRQEVDNIFDPSKGIDKMIDYYLTKGYTLKWIETRIKAIIDRKKLTNTWASNGITDSVDYAILTNEIYKSWSGMTASEYKNFKNIRKENLRDNMTDIEVLLTDLGEIATRDIANTEHPEGLKANIKVAKRGGKVAHDARKSYEKATNKSAISNENLLNIEYANNKKENK